MIHFTSDLHLGGYKLMQETRKEFSSIEEHDALIIDNINSRVRRNDTLVLEGDFCSHKSQVASYRQRINCRHIFFILGNHDHEQSIIDSFGAQRVFTQKMVRLTNGDRVLCAHHPQIFWDRSHYGVPHLFGHIHNNHEYITALQSGFPGARMLDIGIDSAKELLGDYRPFSEEEILDFMKDKPGHEELWRDVPGYEGLYQVSTHGNTRNLHNQEYNPRTTINSRYYSNISCYLDHNYERCVCLYKDGNKTHYTVAELVLLTFKGPCPEGQKVIYRKPECDWLVNLRYG